jgi:hypothetical protein
MYCTRAMPHRTTTTGFVSAASTISENSLDGRLPLMQRNRPNQTIQLPLASLKIKGEIRK